MTASKFTTTKTTLAPLVTQNLEKVGGFENIVGHCDKTTTDVAALDYLVHCHIFKYICNELGTKNTSQFVSKISKMLTNAFKLYQHSRISTTETFLIYHMVFDMLPLPIADKLFPILNQLSDYFRTDITLFSPQAKQSMLRLCNDLLRRLSSTGSRDIQFSGKVQLFLTRLFPIDEKSALNLPSNFNLDNVTEYITEGETTLPLDEAELKKSKGNRTASGESNEASDRLPSEDGEVGDDSNLTLDMDTTEDEVIPSEKPSPVINPKSESTSNVTYKMYKSIWSLQKYFNNPSLLFVEREWMQFEKYADFVVNLFQDYQVESNASHTSSSGSDKSKQNFPKYLTSEQLCHLQIKDVQFRRQLILQLLIIMHYVRNPPLRGPSVTRSENPKLNNRIAMFVMKMGTSLDQLLNLATRKDFCIQILSHEAGWTMWKDKSCPSIQVPNIDQVKLLPNEESLSRKRKIHETAESLVAENKKIKENEDAPSEFMEFIKNQKYDDIPTPVEFFETFNIDNSIWRYKSLRLLSEKSRLFWQMPPSKHCFKPLKHYLETMRERIKKEVAEWENEEEKKKQEDDLSDNEDDDMENLHDAQPETVQKIEKKDPMTDQVDYADIKKLCLLVGDKWEAFALRTLRLKNRELKSIKSDTEDILSRVNMCVIAWQDMHIEDPAQTTRERLHQALKKTPQFVENIKTPSDWCSAL